MYVDDLDVPVSKLSEAAQRVIDRAVEDSRRRDHAQLTSAHLLLAFAQVEWDLFAQAMRSAEVSPHHVLRSLDDHLRRVSRFPGSEVRIAATTKLACRLALHHASRAGHAGIEAGDLLRALLEETRGVPASILRQHGVDPAMVGARLEAHLRDSEVRSERLRRRFELPVCLRQVATNLNLLACLDKLPRVFGRDREIQQVLEILSHRERSNSAMLVGEPGVGKTAIAEGLARRIELEPDTIPVRLRDAQIVSLEMNALVAGTMLRGMFEDRLQNVIREVKERPNLILFVDQAHTIVGAGSALGAPSDAGQIFKSVLARGEVRMIGATTLGEYNSTFRTTRRSRGGFAAYKSLSRRSRKRAESSINCGRGSNGTIPSNFSTRRSRWRSTCRLDTCDTCIFPTR